MKTDFFGRYFKYKLNSLRGTAIAMAIVNFFSVTLIAIGAFIFQRSTEWTSVGGSVYGGWDVVFLMQLIGVVTLIMLAVGSVMLAVTAVKNFAFYNKPEWRDTLGCLPLTHKQRFWSDFLSGLAAHLVSFIPCSAVGTVFVIIAQNDLNRQTALSELSYTEDFSALIPTYLSILLLLLVGYLGIYSLACFVTSCCGRTGSAMCYTFSALVLPTCIAAIYGVLIFNDIIGVRMSALVAQVVPVMPGIGVWASVLLRTIAATTSGDMFRAFWYLTDEPFYLVAALLTIAALTAGAYFLGKHRRAERTGRDVVFGGAYYVISTLIIIAAAGIFLTFTSSPDTFNIINVLIAAFVSFLPFIAVELVHKRSLKRIWTAVIRFAVVFAACIGFAFLGSETDGFGTEKYVPDPSAVKEIHISGYEAVGLFAGSDDNTFVYASDETIAALTGEHRRIVDNLDDRIVSTSDGLVITYELKNGRRVKRVYGSNYTAPSATLNKVYENIRKLEPTDTSALGVVSTRKYDEIRISYLAKGSVTGEEYITPGMEEELMDTLKHDLVNSPRDLNAGHIGIEYTYQGRTYNDGFVIYSTYTDTLDFLKNNGNLLGEPPKTENKAEKYTFCWNKRGDKTSSTVIFLEIVVSTDDENARELFGYVKEYAVIPEGEVSYDIDIYSDRSTKYIAKSDEQAVLKEMLKIAKARAYSKGVIQ